MDELRNLRDMRPDPARRSLSAARNRLTDEAAGRGGRRRPAVWLPVPRRGVARVATAGTLTVTLAAGLIASQTIDFSNGPPVDAGGGGAPDGGSVAVANAGVLLERAADATPDHGPAQPDDFGYVETETVFYAGSPSAAMVRGDEPVRMHVKRWRSVDGSRPGLLRVRTRPAAPWEIPDVTAEPGSPERTTGWQDQREAAEDDPEDPWQPSLFRPNHAYLQSLPHDPDALAAKVYEACASREHECNLGGFELISHVLARGVVPPEVRSGLLEAAKRIDGIELREDVELAATDERGVAIAYTAKPGQEGFGGRFELVFDQDTYEVLGTQKVNVEGWAPPPVAQGGRAERGAGGHSGEPSTGKLGAGERASADAEEAEEWGGFPPKGLSPPIEPGTVTQSTAIVEKAIVGRAGQQP